LKDDFPHEIAQAGAGAAGSVLLRTLHDVVTRHPVAGVSHHMHLCLVTRGEIFLRPSDFTTHFPGGRIIATKMPPVASSWEEYAQFCKDRGLIAAVAAC